MKSSNIFRPGDLITFFALYRMSDWSSNLPSRRRKRRQLWSASSNDIRIVCVVNETDVGLYVGSFVDGRQIRQLVLLNGIVGTIGLHEIKHA